MKGESNARNRNSKLATAIRTKRSKSTIKSTERNVDVIADDSEQSSNVAGIDSTIANDDSGNKTADSGFANGSERDIARDRRNGTGRNGTGSDDNGSDSSANAGRKRGRPRKSETETTEQTLQDVVLVKKRGRKPKQAQDFLPDGMEASVLLLSGLIESLSSLTAVATATPYMQLEKGETRELATAIYNCLEAMPKATRKRFDALFAKYYPFWNLGIVATKIAYPRYQMYKTEEYLKGLQNVSTSETTQVN